jgi:phasin family protein
VANIPEQLAAFNKQQLEAALNMAQAAADHMEKLAELQYRAAKNAYADSVNTLRQLVDVKDANQLANVATGLAQPALERSSAYAKDMYAALAAAQTQLATTLEQQVAEFNRNMMGMLDAAARSAPPGAEAPIAALRTAMQSANTVYEMMVKGARSMADVAQTNINAVSQTFAGRK